MSTTIHTTAKNSLLLIIAGIAALSAGGWIYVTGRPNTYIHELCSGYIASSQGARMSEFVRYSLPDGLWSLSSILILHAILRKEPSRRRIAIVAIVPALGIGSELLQCGGWVPGVFDIKDLAAYAIPLTAYLITTHLIQPNQNRS